MQRKRGGKRWKEIGKTGMIKDIMQKKGKNRGL